MNHLSEEQIVLYHFAEARFRVPAERQAVEEHLAACNACRANYDALEVVLAAVDAAPVPERGEDYGRHVWQRLVPRLDERAGFNWSAWLLPHRWAAAAAMAALLLGAFLLGRFWPRPEAPPTAAVSPQVRERILLVAVGDHLERSQMVLVELANTPADGTVDISAEQRLAQELVPENRLYRQTAARAGDAAVASVLDELERVLLEIAHSPSQLSSAQLEEIRRRIEAQGILFKVRVVGSQVREREKTEAKGPAGGIS